MLINELRLFVKIEQLKELKTIRYYFSSFLFKSNSNMYFKSIILLTKIWTKMEETSKKTKN